MAAVEQPSPTLPVEYNAPIPCHRSIGGYGTEPRLTHARPVMKRDNLQHISIVLQSFTVFVALSILLGRVYYLTYYEFLGIPTPEGSLNAIDYAIISPDVTAFSIGTSGLFGLYLWARNTLIFPQQVLRHRVLFAICILIVSWLIIIVDMDLVSEPFPNSGIAGIFPNVPGMYGLWVVLPLAIQTVGLALLHSSDGENEDTEATKPRTANSKGLRLLFIVVAVAVLVYNVLIISAFGAISAGTAIQSAPEALVEFKSPALYSLRQEDACVNTEDNCVFKVVLTNNHFVYLRPVDAGPSLTKQLWLAIPINDISKVIYLREDR